MSLVDAMEDHRVTAGIDQSVVPAAAAVDYSLPKGYLFLGLDCSTQSLKVTVLDANLKIFATEVVVFDKDLPHYKTKDGVYRDPLVNGRIVSPTLMWVEALDLVLQKLEDSKIELHKIIAVSGSAQQHGSVYWKNGSYAILGSLHPRKPLVDQLSDAFSVKDSPIWMDCSTTQQCRAIEKAVGGALELSKLTGSCAHERYAGPQIRKLYETQPEVYENTERISLISSFMASLLLGGYACIDQTDGAGMNLMDIKSRTWSKIALEATAPDLEKRLGNLVPAHAVAGFISNYYVERYHFRRDCLVVQWSGDNPNSLADLKCYPNYAIDGKLTRHMVTVGLTLNTPGDLAISLGTSDTAFGISTELKPGLEGHIFPDPVDMQDYMVMLVYKNGSLTREDIRNRCANKCWEVFNSYLEQTPPLNGGKLGFYYKEHEILPPLPIGEHRYIVENFENNSQNGLKEDKILECNAASADLDLEHHYVTEGSEDKSPEELKKNAVLEFDAPSEVRALIEGQLLSIRAHVERIGMSSPPRRIIATGGASANKCILNLIASIFGCDVYTVQRPDSASLGAALRAAHGWLCHEKGAFVPIKCMYKDNLEQTSLVCKLSAPAGDQQLFAKYTLLMKKRAEIENDLVRKLGRA